MRSSAAALIKHQWFSSISEGVGCPSSPGSSGAQATAEPIIIFSDDGKDRKHNCSIRTNANEDTETVTNQSKQVGKRVPDWSFLKRVGKKRKCGFKVYFFLSLHTMIVFPYTGIYGYL